VSEIEELPTYPSWDSRRLSACCNRLQHESESELSALSLELCFNLTNEDLPLLFGSPRLSKLSIAHNTQFD
jgi:hypothetical protein